MARKSASESYHILVASLNVGSEGVCWPSLGEGVVDLKMYDSLSLLLYPLSSSSCYILARTPSRSSSMPRPSTGLW